MSAEDSGDSVGSLGDGEIPMIDDAKVNKIEARISFMEEDKPKPSYKRMRAPTLLAVAAKRGFDTDQAVDKAELVRLLEESDAQIEAKIDKLPMPPRLAEKKYRTMSARSLLKVASDKGVELDAPDRKAIIARLEELEEADGGANGAANGGSGKKKKKKKAGGKGGAATAPKSGGGGDDDEDGLTAVERMEAQIDAMEAVEEPAKYKRMRSRTLMAMAADKGIQLSGEDKASLIAKLEERDRKIEKRIEIMVATSAATSDEITGAYSQMPARQLLALAAKRRIVFQGAVDRSALIKMLDERDRAKEVLIDHMEAPAPKQHVSVYERMPARELLRVAAQHSIGPEQFSDRRSLIEQLKKLDEGELGVTDEVRSLEAKVDAMEAAEEPAKYRRMRSRTLLEEAARRGIELSTPDKATLVRLLEESDGGAAGGGSSGGMFAGLAAREAAVERREAAISARTEALRVRREALEARKRRLEAAAK